MPGGSLERKRTNRPRNARERNERSKRQPLVSCPAIRPHFTGTRRTSRKHAFWQRTSYAYTAAFSIAWQRARHQEELPSPRLTCADSAAVVTSKAKKARWT